MNVTTQASIHRCSYTTTTSTSFSTLIFIIIIMRLKAILTEPDTPKHILEALEQCGIKTPTDFIFGIPLETLIRRLPHDSLVTYAELSFARERVIKAMAPEGITADKLLAITLKKKSRIKPSKTAFIRLNSLLDAMKYGVLEIAGVKSVGKSVSC